MKGKNVVMVGDSLQSPGGIAAVLRTYEACGFFQKYRVRYLSNYEGAGLLRQGRVMFRSLAECWRQLSGGQVGLVHIHSASRGSFWRAALFAALARRAGVPYLIHVHSGEFPDFFQACGTRGQGLIRHCLMSAAGVICLSPGWVRILGELVPGAAFASLPNPVLLPSELPDSGNEGQARILFLGRLNEKKGLLDLLAAMPAVVAACPKARLVLAGDGERAMLEDEAARLGVAAAVEFPGWVDGAYKARLLAEASLLVLPSHFEAFGVAVLEAMAWGKPVVATRVGGIPEVLEDGVHGLLVPPHDPPALAAALQSLLADRQLGLRMGLAGKVHVRARFGAEIVLSSLAQFYEQLLEGQSRLQWKEG